MKLLACVALFAAASTSVGCHAVHMDVGDSRDGIRFAGADADFWIEAFEKSAGGVAPDRNAEAVRALVHLAPSSATAREHVRTLLVDQDDRLFDHACTQLRQVPGSAALFEDELIDAVLMSGPRAHAALRLLLHEALAGDRGAERLEQTLRTELHTLDPQLAGVLNEEVWWVVSPDVERTPNPRALFLARCAVWLDRHRSAAYLNTLAWALYWNGEREEAITMGRESLAKLRAGDEDRAQYEDAQRRFEAP